VSSICDVAFVPSRYSHFPEWDATVKNLGFFRKAAMMDCYNPCNGARSFGFFEPNAGLPKGDRMFSRSMLKTFLFASFLLVTVATACAAAPPNETAPSSVGTIHTYLMPDLSLKSVFSIPVVVQPTSGVIHRTCRCSCGTISCTSDFDCDGASCDGFITCNCAKRVGDWFPGAEQSSRETALPTLKGSCK